MSDRLIHLGAPDDTESYIQETGWRKGWEAFIGIALPHQKNQAVL